MAHEMQEMPVPTVVMLQVFDTLIIRIRLRSLEAMLNRGDYARMVRLLEDCLVHTDGYKYTDLPPECMSCIQDLFLALQCMLLCGVHSNARQVLGKVWDLLNKNEWDQCKDKWGWVLAARLGGQDKDVGSLSKMPNDILCTIKELLV